MGCRTMSTSTRTASAERVAWVRLAWHWLMSGRRTDTSHRNWSSSSSLTSRKCRTSCGLETDRRRGGGDHDQDTVAVVAIIIAGDDYSWHYQLRSVTSRWWCSLLAIVRAPIRWDTNRSCDRLRE